MAVVLKFRKHLDCFVIQKQFTRKQFRRHDTYPMSLKNCMPYEAALVVCGVPLDKRDGMKEWIYFYSRSVKDGMVYC